MKSNPRKFYKFGRKPIPSWVIAELNKISNCCHKISDYLRTVFITDVLSNSNTLTLNQLHDSDSDKINQPSIQSDSNEDDNDDHNANSFNQKIKPLSEVKQLNRLKSNQKKRIAFGRICTVNCIHNDQIIKGYIVTFQYYSIQLRFGPCLKLFDIQKIRLDARQKLFLLNITKKNSRQVILRFLEEYTHFVELNYTVLDLYHKECN